MTCQQSGTNVLSVTSGAKHQSKSRKTRNANAVIQITRHKISKEECDWVMYREKSTSKAEGKTYLWLPDKSTVTLNDIVRFHNLTVEQVGKKGVFLRLN